MTGPGEVCQVCRPSSPRPARPCSVHVLVKRQTKSVSDFLQHIPTYKDDIQRISTGCAVWTTFSSTISSVGKSYFVFHYRLPWFQYIHTTLDWIFIDELRVKMSLIFWKQNFVPVEPKFADRGGYVRDENWEWCFCLCIRPFFNKRLHYKWLFVKDLFVLSLDFLPGVLISDLRRTNLLSSLLLKQKIASLDPGTRPWLFSRIAHY